MRKIADNILLKVENLINRYSLFANKSIAVAYSGGKDSLFLCHCLAELGFDVIPIIVDIGYKNDWKVAIDNLKTIGLKACLLEPDIIENSEIKLKVEGFFENIIDIKAGNYPNASPCTPCYNAKMVLLEWWAKRNGFDRIAMGHHGTDAIASMLKSYFMYYDRWRECHTEYRTYNFMKVIQQHKPLFQMEEKDFLETLFYQDLELQLKNQNAGTDEAILQETELSIKVCRPLYEVTEDEILTYYKGEDISFNLSECFFTKLRDSDYLTPREMVQYELLRGAKPDVLAVLMHLNYISIDHLGRLVYRARNNRNMILGSSYKTNIINEKKF